MSFSFSMLKCSKFMLNLCKIFKGIYFNNPHWPCLPYVFLENPWMPSSVIHQTSRIPRYRLTGGRNPTFDSCVEGKNKYRDILMYSQNFFQIIHDCTFIGTADLNWFGVVAFKKQSGAPTASIYICLSRLGFRLLGLTNLTRYGITHHGSSQIPTLY